MRSKFYQDVPLWDVEIRGNQVKWLLRFEFDVEFLLPESRGIDGKVSIPRGGYFRRPLIPKRWEEMEPIIRALNPGVSIEALQGVSVLVSSDKVKEIPSTHNDIKSLLLEIGKLQSRVTDSEFLVGKERLEVVWRRLPESVPTYVFEVRVGGNLYHALGKLKHAYDIWNSRVFLVAREDDFSAVNQLLSGTFHEIKSVVKFIETQKIQNLYQSKQNIHKIEKGLGLIP